VVRASQRHGIGKENDPPHPGGTGTQRHHHSPRRACRRRLYLRIGVETTSAPEFCAPAAICATNPPVRNPKPRILLIIAAVAVATLLIGFVIWKYSLCYHITYNADYCNAHLIW